MITHCLTWSEPPRPASGLARAAAVR